MSPRSLVAVVALSAAFALSSFAQEVAPPPGSGPNAAAAAAAAAPPPPTSEEIFEVYGWIMGDQNNLVSLGMSETEIAAFVQGLATHCRGNQPPENINDVVQVAQKFLSERAREVFMRSAVPNQEEEKAEMAKLDANPAVKKTESGLRYEILEPGSDVKPTPQDTVVAHYTLSFPDGTVKESSRTGGGDPAQFALNRVIPAWTEGLQLIGVGGHIKLYVPSDLGYGPQGSPNGIPPAKMLLFDIELVDVKQAAPAAAAPAPAGH
jgi:FKBP-type peptidyl-prolyl cis-trans isomerase